LLSLPLCPVPSRVICRPIAPLDFKAALRAGLTVAAFDDLDAQNLGQQAFHRETYRGMLSSERRKRTTGAAQTPDLVTPKLPALLDYQLKLRAPAPPRGSFNQAAARRGEQLFSGAARCAACHTPPTFTDVLSGPDPNVPFLHAPSEIGAESVYASRSATGMYRTTPLRGIWQHPPYFHDGSAADLPAVVNHYDAVFSLGLTAGQKADLVHYLKSL
jgi:mono/diheme cytochrome c family protein